jgi:hypothetical protein
MKFPNLPIENISDYNIQKCFVIIRDFLRGNSPLAGFKLLTVSLNQNFSGTTKANSFVFAHNLGFLPQDIVISSQTGVGQVSFNQNLTDGTNLYLAVTGTSTTAGPLVVRFFVGTYQGAL